MKFNKIVLIGMALSAILAVSASAAFEKTNTYTDGKFADVPAAQWYASEVKNTYELGLMNGTSETTFNPDGYVSVAEAVTMASRATAIYAGETIPAADGEWYQMYVNYATSKGFVKEGQFDSLDRNITRAEMAVLFYDAMPEGYFKRINNVNELVDVDKNADYYNKILNLYNAGIVMGNDDYGNFNPQSPIKRSESAAIINRVALEESRVRRALIVANPKEHPATVFFIDDINSAYGHKTNLVSGWDYDNRLSFTDFADTQTATLADIYSDGGLRLKRDINPLTEGKFTLHTSASVTTTDGGFYFLLTDDDGLDVVRLCTDNGVYTVKCGENVINTGVAVKPSIQFTVKGDLDTKCADLYFDGKIAASFDMSAETKEITKYIVGTTDEGKANLTLKNVQLYSNFLVNDIFMSTPTGSLPTEWISNDDTASVVAAGGNKGVDINSIRMSPKAGVNSYARRYFDAAKGKLVFETYIHTPKGVSGVYVAAKQGDTVGFKVVTNGNNFETSKGILLRKYTDNVWQCIRIEADTATGKALIKINGKIVGEYAFDNAVTYFDNIEIGATPSSDTVLTFDDIVVYTHHDYDDYVPVPVPAVSEGYDIGVQVCSLWRNGYHYGWDTLSNFPELEPYLGYYDEGLPEVADWEIKYMVEHGIDFQHFCWYCPSSDTKEPIKSPNMFESLHDGYFNAKYSDMMKFNIMWENGSTNIKSFENFKNFVWSYWMDYYFTDDRYMTVDNKPVLTIWSYTEFIKAFGGEAKAKEAVDFMNEDIKKIGRDGMIILFHDNHNQSAGIFETMKAAGADGTYAYNLNTTGYDPDYQINRHKTQRATGVFHNTASIGVGFNRVGWAGAEERVPLITNEDFEKVARFMKDEYLKETEGDGQPWHSTLIFVSSWNEFGEGHYIAPTGYNGFGYLDVIRKVFTDNNADTHNDVKPTEAQKTRINQLYPKGRSIIDQLILEEKPASYITLGEIEINEENFKDYFSHKEFKIENGIIRGSSESNDYAFRTDGFKIDSNTVKVIKVRAKISEKSSFNVYFKTNTTDWNSTNIVKCPVNNTDEYVDYYFDFSKIAGWKDTVTVLRFDPTSCPASYEIEKVELLGLDMINNVSLEINTEKIEKLPLDPAMDNGNVMVAIKLGTGILSRMSLYHEYSRFDKTFYLASKEHEILMTEGKNTALFDGKEVTMPFTYTTHNGLPYIALDYIAKLFEFKVTLEDGKLSITTISDTQLDTLNNRVEYQYGFDIPGMTEGWTPAGTSLEVTENGIIRCIAKEITDRPGYFDPSLYSPAISVPAVAYPTIEIRMKTNLPEDTAALSTIYFNIGSGYAESRTLRIKISSVEKDAEGYGIYKFDMSSNKEWAGTVSAIRFDPFNCDGTAEIDYIKFIRDESVKLSQEELNGSVIVNGGAEQSASVSFYDGGSNISIVEDPDNKGNKCYQITNKVQGVQSWTYFRHKYTFEPGATYLVEFDAKIKSFNDGNSDVENCWININFVYLDDSGKKDHFVNAVKISTADGWVHVEKELTVLPETSDRKYDSVAFYSNPIGGIGVDYYMDNIIVTKIS